MWVRALLLALSLSAAACGSQEGAPQREPIDLLVLGGTVVTMDARETVLEEGAVAVRDGAIVAVGPADAFAARYRAAQTLRAGAHDIVLPGLINGHNHASMSLLRGVADDLTLMDWLQRYIFPAEAAAVDEEFVRVGARLAALEMIAGGTTTFVDMYYFEDAVAEEIDAAGLRAILGETILDFPAPDHADPTASLEYTRRFIERWRGHPRIVATAAPHAPYTVSPEVLRQAVALTRAHGVPILIHLAETRDELAQIRERYGATPVQHLDRLGFLGPDVIAAHAIWLDDDDIATLAARGVGVVHNPESNMKLASGAMRLVDLRAAGVAVGLGTDGPASNNDLDMFGALLVAALLHKQERADPTALPARVALALATREGARALGMQDTIGSLEAGKRADLVVVDGDQPNLVPRYDPYSHLVYAARAGDVRATVVEGRVLYRDGEYLTLDRAAVVRQARRVAERVREVVASSGRAIQ